MSRARLMPEVKALLAFLAIYLSWLALGWIPGDAKSLEIAFLAPIDALVVWASWRASRRVEAEPWLRSFWKLIAIAWTAELLADLSLALYDIVLKDPTFPSIADLFFLLFYVVTLLALLKIPAARGSGSQRLRIALDTATIAVGGAAAVWYFVLGPTVTEGGQGLLGSTVSVAYPVADIALVGVLGMLLMRRSPSIVRTPLRFAAIGLALMVIADTIYGYLQLHEAYAPGDAVDVLYGLLVVPFVLAAASQRAIGPGEVGRCKEEGGEPPLRASRLPLVAMLLGFGILLGTQRHDPFFPDLSLLLLALALAGLVALRQHVAQGELLQLQGRVRTIVENVAEGIVTFDEAGTIIWVNPAAETYFGTESGGLGGQSVDVLFEGLSWPEMAPLVGVDGAPGPAMGKHLKFTGRRGDGSVFPAEIVVTEARLDSERILIAIGEDVSVRTHAEAALRESEARFRGIFDSAGVGIAFSALEDGRPRIVEVNAALTRMLGFEIGELRGDDFGLITHPDDRADLAEIDERVRSGSDSITREQRCVRKDGSFLWVSLTISIIRDEGDVPRFAIGMLEDITQRKEAERVKDEFVSVVGHELRTPLTSIRGSLGLLEGGILGELPEEAAAMVGTAVLNTDRLVRLINDILDIERIDSGRADIEPASVAAHDLIEQAAQVIEAVAADAGVEVEVAASDLVVTADADRIVQTLINLIGNAVKFSQRGDRVVVRAQRDGDRALFTVADSGRGIPADQLDSIFERFNQVDASDAREKGGTGLGLAISRSIVERHGGSIWVESEEGTGAIFHFTLPLPADHAGAARARAGELVR